MTLVLVASANERHPWQSASHHSGVAELSPRFDATHRPSRGFPPKFAQNQRSVAVRSRWAPAAPWVPPPLPPPSPRPPPRSRPPRPVQGTWEKFRKCQQAATFFCSETVRYGTLIKQWTVGGGAGGLGWGGVGVGGSGSCSFHSDGTSWKRKEMKKEKKKKNLWIENLLRFAFKLDNSYIVEIWRNGHEDRWRKMIEVKESQWKYTEKHT